MTKNQIEYNKLLETRRSNMRQEELTASRDMEVARHNLAGEGLQRMSLDETARANRAREKETERSNRANEALTGARDAETARANRAKEYLGQLNYEETARANRAQEQYRDQSLALQSRSLDETIRANQARENLTSRELDIKSGQLQYNYANLAETRRSNLAKEVETNRSNLARELEANRSNLANELETNRSNLAREQETNRHNKVSEGVDIARAATYATDVAGKLLFYNKDRNIIVNNSPVQIEPSKNYGSSNGGNTGVVTPNPPNDKTGGNVYVYKSQTSSQARQGASRSSGAKREGTLSQAQSERLLRKGILPKYF